MSMDSIHKETFKAGSKTYYNSSIFFPKKDREDVFVFYGFVRVADNYVDQVPQDKEGFLNFKEKYFAAMEGSPANDIIIDSFVELSKRKNFDPEWAKAFLYSMELDLTKKIYETLDETLEYIYGSAEVIGLFMVKILGLPKQSYKAAQMQGRAMQFINFIRDVAEDETLGRIYLPQRGVAEGLVSREGAQKNPYEFSAYIREQLILYDKWQKEAEEGYKFIPKRILIPIKTASDMYNWTGRQIAKDPMLIFKRKVKPAKLRIIGQIIKNAITI
jgi:phytoene synthase